MTQAPIDPRPSVDPRPAVAPQTPVAPQNAAGRGDVLRAAVWMLGSVVSFTSMAIAGRAVSGKLDTFEIMTFRSAVGLAVVLAVGIATGRTREARMARAPLQVLRNLAHFTGQNLWFLALTMIPIAQVFALEFTSPLWILVLAPLVLGERVRPLQYAVAAIGFCGVLVVARPFGGGLSPGLLWAALAALAFATTGLLTRRLTRTETVWGILIWLTTTQLVMGAICAGFDGDVAWPGPAELPWIVLIGLAGLAAHWCLTTALSLADVSTVMPVDFLRLPIAAAAGAVLYGEAVDPFVLLGGAIVFAAAWANLRIASRAA